MIDAISGFAASQARHRTVRFLALGDSYTVGEGVADAERWPVQLAAALRREGYPVDTPEMLAQTGWTTDELADAMDGHAFHPPYQLVSLLIGVNNQYRGRDLQNYRDEFRALLNRVIELADGKPQSVIVISIPDWGVTRFGRESRRDVTQIAREIDAFNAAKAQIAQQLDAQYIDIAALSRDGGASDEALIDDGLHPSGLMYARWTQAILPTARLALSSS